MWPCLGWHGHCSAIGPVGTARHGFCLIVPCLGHHHGTLALSGTAGVPPCLPCPCLAVPCHVVPVPVPCRAARLENYNGKDYIHSIEDNNTSLLPLQIPWLRSVLLLPPQAWHFTPLLFFIVATGIQWSPHPLITNEVLMA
jgi:hypothetical protein